MEHMKVRRVVTGHDFQGKARVVDDRDVEPITSGLMPDCAAYRLWGRDERPTLPDDARHTAPRHTTRPETDRVS
ncbi:hypothetical protein [Fodinicola feengrottensis]|uniref:hypothetical protein n=1 Tax=Fodinicola feengrottensis TaxID=435914 RepID=UPI00244173E7|nr:hypothetical protein [Fodinicola feengrottensis]